MEKIDEKNIQLQKGMQPQVNSTSKLGFMKSASQIKHLSLLLVMMFAFFFLFACIELKPREGISSTIPVTITTGSDVCAGYNESTCGAFLKEKRTATSNYVCEGPIGPESRKVQDYKYKFDPDSGWICEKTEKTFTLYTPYKSTSDRKSAGNGGSSFIRLKIPFTVFNKGLTDMKAICSLKYSITSSGQATITSALVQFSGNIITLFDNQNLGGKTDCSSYKGSNSYSNTLYLNINSKLQYFSDVIEPNVELNWTTSACGSCHECHKCRLVGKCCSDRGWCSEDTSLTLSCRLSTTYAANFICRNPYTGETYDFVNCSYDEFSTFQGGRTFLDNNTPFSKLSSYLQSYYGTYSYNPATQEVNPAGDIQVPFFMLGQGPSFQDYEEAKQLCVPWKETIVNVSLGNTTFDPPFLTIPEKMELCLNNNDNKKHDIDIIDLSNQEIVRQFTLQPTQSACYKPFEGFYHVKDSNGDYAYLSVLKSTDTAQIYVGSRIIPNYTIVTNVTAGGSINFINFSLLERKEHNLTIKSINRFDEFNYEKNITLNLSNPVQTIPAPQSGEYQIKDNSTGSMGYLFVQSPLYRFIFRSNGSVDPDYEIYRPLGDTICFKSETEGLNLSIYRYTETENGYEWVWLTNETMSTSSYCCIQGILPGKYQGISSNNTVVNWTIGSGKPSATLNIQGIGFEPDQLDSPPGTKVCWVNPSAATRQITTKSSTGKTFFTGSIPPLSDNVCWPTMNKTDSFTTKFVPDIGPKNIINIKEIETKNIQILQGGSFDIPSAVVKPGAQVCWINNDKTNHTLKTESGAYVTLAPSQINCIEKDQMIEGALFSRELENGMVSQVGVIDGAGFMLTSRGPIPLNLFVDLPETNMSSDGSLQVVKPSYFKIINKQTVPSELYEVSYVSLLSNSTSIASLIEAGEDTTLLQNPIKTYTKVHLIIDNSDDKNHTIRVEETGDIVIIPAQSYYEFDLGQSVTLTDLTIKENLTRSGVTNQTIINGLSQIPVTIVGPSEIKLGKAGTDSAILDKLQAPMEAMSVILYENNTNGTIALSFGTTKMGVLENPLNNLTLDLPVQVIHGDLSSQILYDMRKYADAGAMSMLVPSFKNVTVTIHSSVFSPSTASIPAGSKITFTNKDVIDHYINLTQNTNGTITYRSFTLAPLQSNSTSETPKNTTFTFYDQLSNMQGNITVVAYDANIGIKSIPIYPETGMVAVGGPVKFNNYDSDSDFKVEIVLKDLLNVEHTYTLNLPKYSNGIPGFATWIPDTAGNASYIVRNASDIIGSGNITVRNSIINVSIINGKFGTKSISVDHQSKVCFTPNSARTISITNADTGEKVAERIIYPVGTAVTDQGGDTGLCKRIYNCTAKQSIASDVVCNGTVEEGNPDTHCTYAYINPKKTCQVNTTFACESKNPDMVCASDYSKDMDSNKTGIQPLCLFTASSTGNACNATATPKSGVSSFISCGPVVNNYPTFNYIPYPSSLWKFNESNDFCDVKFKDGQISCTMKSNPYALSCLPTIDKKFCYAVPFVQQSTGSTYTTNEFCTVSSVSPRNVTGVEIIRLAPSCRYWAQVGGVVYCIEYTSPSCPQGYTKIQGPGYCTSWSYGVFSSTCKRWYPTVLCVKDVNITCSQNSLAVSGCSDSVLKATGYPTCQVSTNWRTGEVTITNPTCILSCNQTALTPCSVDQCRSIGSNFANQPLTCHKENAVSYVDPRYPAGRTVTDVKTCSYGGYVDYSSGSPNYAYTTRTNYPFSCAFLPSPCPCDLNCTKASSYQTLNNFDCSVVGNKCIPTNTRFNNDDGTYCIYNINSTCIPTSGYEGKVLCSLANASCQLSQLKYLTDTGLDAGKKCDLNLYSCESKYEGVNCSFDPVSGSCKATAEEQFCFTPASTYIVTDLGSGDTMTIEGYDRYTPLEINVQKSEFTPSLVTTSPLSDVCFRSLDGKQHTVIVPEQVLQEGKITVKPNEYTCIKFPYNPEPWGVYLEDKRTIAAGIKSIKQDIEIIVKSQMFDPSDVTLRPGTTLTFVNTDPIQHTLSKTNSSTNITKLLLRGDDLIRDSFFNLNSKVSWIDKIQCRNDSDCPSGSFCDVEGRCHPVKQCLTDKECPAGSICSNYVCILAKSCNRDSDCGANSTCVDNKCIATTVSCNSNLECPAGSACVSNKCTAVKNCSVSSDCPSGMICDKGYCNVAKTCSNNDNCSMDSACINGYCSTPPVPECSSSADCPNGLTCEQVDVTEDGNPVKACIGIGCDANSFCSTQYPNYNTTCITNFINEQIGQGNCTLYNVSQSICSSDLDCLSGACILGKCVISKSCAADSDCPQISGRSTVCLNNICRLPLNCTTSSDCPSGDVCEAGFCRAPAQKTCTNDSDCEPSQICHDLDYGRRCVYKQNCTATLSCNLLQPGAACTNMSSTSPAFCQSSTNCTSDAFCSSNAYCDTRFGLNECITYPKTTCNSPLYGTNVSEVNVSFKLPPTTYKAYLIYSFNDNGKVTLNGQEILPTTTFRCQYSTADGVIYKDAYSPPQQWRIPLGLLQTGDKENNMTVTVCSCSGEKGFNISINYYYVTPQGIQAESIVIDPNSKTTIPVPNTVEGEDFVYLDSQTKNVLPVSIKPIVKEGQVNCAPDLSSMALAVASYERLDYATQACDSGKQVECASYNPYGPATVTFFSSESGLNLSDPNERMCAFQQIASVKNICPNCTTVLNVGDANITELKDILDAANTTTVLGNPAINYIDVIGYEEYLNKYSTCSFEDIMNSIINKSKLGLYNYTKPSVIIKFGLKEGESLTNPACNWTAESIITAYQDFYGLWIPMLAGAGVLGTAQYCLTDPCPNLDFYGLLTSGKTNKPFTDAWFREGCGRYYYAAEGLSFTTFSMKETNYSLCDPSRMLALLQSAQCAMGKYTLKTGTS